MPVSALSTMIASASSAMLARIPLHPIDTVKAQMQVDAITNKAKENKNIKPGILKTFQRIFRKEGFRGLYSGFPIVFLGSAPAGCFFLYHMKNGKIFN